MAKQELVDIEKQLKNELDSMAGAIQKAAGTRIRIGGGKFTIPDRGTLESMEVVILGFINRNEYYEGSYDRNTPNRMVCFAHGLAQHSDLVPVPEVPEPVSESCDECPNQVWGSGQNGKGKACKNTVLLALVEPDATPKSPIYTINVPPTSLGGPTGWNAFCRNELALGTDKSRHPMLLVTRISFDTSSDWPKLKFELRDHDPINAQIKVHATMKSHADDVLHLVPNFAEKSDAA